MPHVHLHAATCTNFNLTLRVRTAFPRFFFLFPLLSLIDEIRCKICVIFPQLSQFFSLLYDQYVYVFLVCDVKCEKFHYLDNLNCLFLSNFLSTVILPTKFVSFALQNATNVMAHSLFTKFSWCDTQFNVMEYFFRQNDIDSI